MSVIVGFEVDRHVSSPGKRPLDKQTSALSMALNSPSSCESPASQRLRPAAFCCSDQRSDDAEDAYSCYSDEDDDEEDLPSESSSQHSMPIPRLSSRVAKLFAYARFQLHVQQAQLQELQQQHDTTLHQQHYHCQVQRAPHGGQQQQQRLN